MCDYLLTGEVARLLNRSAATVHYYNRTGKLTATRATGGVRLFLREDVERLAAELNSDAGKPAEQPVSAMA